MQKRIGKDKKPFILYKFRTMKEKIKLENKEKIKINALPKNLEYERITLIGKILRRTCLDEIPQLINVLKGEMSLVGPRPHLPEEIVLFKKWREARFDVKPGLTGLWQINGRHELDHDRAALLDIYYIQNMSLLYDIEIILKTIPAIIFSEGEW